MILDTISKEIADEIVKYARTHELNASQEKELVSCLLRVPDIYRDVASDEPHFIILKLTALRIAAGCDVLTSDFKKILFEYISFIWPIS